MLTTKMLNIEEVVMIMKKYFFCYPIKFYISLTFVCFVGFPLISEAWAFVKN